MRKHLTIIAHLPHYEINGKYFSYEPYVREIVLWSEIFERVTLYTEISNSMTASTPILCIPANVQVKELKMKSGPGVINNLKRLAQLPFCALRVLYIVWKSNFLHLRSPGITALIGNFYVKYLFWNKRLIVKWATSFFDVPEFTFVQRLELAILQKPRINTRILIYGPSNNPRHIESFPAVMYNWELDRIISNSHSRSWEGKIKLLCVGRLYRFKNFHSVILGLYEFQKINSEYDWELNIVGDGECRNSLMDLINQCQLEDRINLLGSKSYNEALNLYSESHISIMPGRAEGWSKVINESWATGCLPLVIKSGNSTYPLKFAPQAGVVYEPTVEDFSQKLLEIFQMSDRDRAIIFSEGLKANRKLTLEIYKSNLEELIDDYYVPRKKN